MRNHELSVREFFEKCRKDNPDKLREVSEKYPVMSRSKRLRTRRRESTVGLLGLQPANLPDYIAFEYGYESIFNKELEEESM